MEAFDGYWEDLTNNGVSEEQEQLLYELELVQCRVVDPGESGYDTLDVVELTALGRSLLAEATKGNETDG